MKQKKPDMKLSSKNTNRLRIFLIHSSADNLAVRELYQRLRADGFDPWLDEEDLLPGQDWRQEILRAVRAADVVLVCLSRNSIGRSGYTQKEIKLALDVADEQPEGSIVVIPVRLEECNIPDRLHNLHGVNLFEEQGYERLVRALYYRANQLGIDNSRNQTDPSVDRPDIQVEVPQPRIPQTRLVELHQLLVERFSESELRALCFDLGIDFDDLASEGKSGKARELIAYLDRRGRLPELISFVRQQRPDVPWDVSSDTPKTAQAAHVGTVTGKLVPLQRFFDEHITNQTEQLATLMMPVVQGVTDGTLGTTFDQFENRVEQVLQEFVTVASLGGVSRYAVGNTPIEPFKPHILKNGDWFHPRCTPDQLRESRFAAFWLDTGTAFENLRIPNPMLVLASAERQFSPEAIEKLRSLLVSSGIGSGSRIALLLLFCETDALSTARRHIVRALGSVFAYDVVVVNHGELLAVGAAADAQQSLRRTVLPQVNLVTVAPYVTNGPTPPHFFFGREHELREIVDHATSASYVITGGRRVGKTSVLNCLHSMRLPAKNLRTLYHDCSTTPTFADFLAAPLRDWQPAAPVSAPATFGDLLQAPPHDKPLVLLLDEADKLIPSDRAANWRLFNTLRALVNAGHAQIVLSGERTLRDAMRDPTSPLFNFVNEILLGPLDYRAVEELVTRPMKQLELSLFEEQTLVRQIWAFTSGHPNVVQRLCRRLVERINQQGKRSITPDDVDAVIADPQFQEQDFLETYWWAASPLEKIITLLLAQKAKTYRLKEVRQLLETQAAIIPGAAETKAALDRLVDLRSILRRSSAGYEFAVEAFPMVLANTTTVEDLLEVFVEEYQQAEQPA
jgi:hypothetical protein